jgi:predicted phage terminase large subunit-like protein
MKNYKTRKQAKEFYRDTISDARRRGPEQEKLATEKLGRHDLYFLATSLLDRFDDFTFGSDKRKEQIFQWCRMVQLDPNEHLDLWARGHYKTSIITQLMTVQDILNDPEVTIGIFSFNNQRAKEPYNVIRNYLKYMGELGLYSEVLYADPDSEARPNGGWWTIDEGLTVKRKGNPRESTLNSFGLIDSMPVGSHFKIRVYDDVITDKHVTNPDMIKKAVESWELSLDLTDHLPVKHYGRGDISRYIGTRYHFNDPYKTIMERGVAEERRFPATDDGTPMGKPIFLTQDELDKKRREKGPYVFACQQLLNPVADDVQGFKYEWICWYTGKTGRWWDGMNLYLIVDPAGEKRRENDYTSMWVIGLGGDNNYYLIDGIRDRLNLTERTQRLMNFHRKYNPLAVGYEKYGKDSDIEHIEYVQNQENYRFRIIPLAGATKKEDRIRRLVPVFENNRFWLPPYLNFIDYEGKQRDLIREFVKEEYEAFPVGVHDDMLDCMARIVDENEVNKKKGWNPIFPDPMDASEQFSVQQANTDYDVLNYMNAA